MPRQQPTLSFQQVRTLTEKWTWRDPRTGLEVTGFNPPESARRTARQKPYHIKYVTKRGVLEEGEVITLKVHLRRHQRMVKFTASNAIRMVNDCLICEIDGIRIVTH